MPDIDLYTEDPGRYDHLQHLRPDYVEAIQTCLRLSAQFVMAGNARLLDLCCGTGTNSLRISEQQALAKVELVDINSDFLRIARSSGIESRELTVIERDVREYRPRRDFNLVLSIFAYHHMPDSDKSSYVDTIANALVEDGVLLLAEIFFQNKASEKAYYQELIDSIPQENQTDQLRRFLEQTANSNDFEFKVPKIFADNQFRRKNFALIHERKIWPRTDDENGTYVQVYKYSCPQQNAGSGALA